MGEAKRKRVLKQDTYNQAIKGVPMPPQIMALPVSETGYPVPWFVAWFEEAKGGVKREVRRGTGRPDFRLIGKGRVERCIREGLCWVCGGSLRGTEAAAVIGPMCTINRISSEPPSHLSCARYSAKACPFLTRPRMRRNLSDLPVEGTSAPGFAVDRNPGVAAIWVTNRVAYDRGTGLFHLGEPERIEWTCQGREAVLEEILESIRSGVILLREACDQEETPERRAEAHALLSSHVDLAMRLVLGQGASRHDAPASLAAREA